MFIASWNAFDRITFLLKGTEFLMILSLINLIQLLLIIINQPWTERSIFSSFDNFLAQPSSRRCESDTFSDREARKSTCEHFLVSWYIDTNNQRLCARRSWITCWCLAPACAWPTQCENERLFRGRHTQASHARNGSFKRWTNSKWRK